MPTKGGILSYFKPQSQEAQGQRISDPPVPMHSQSFADSVSPLLSQPPSSPSSSRLPSSAPVTPSEPTATKVVIEDTDEDGDDSDDSLPDLMSRPAAVPAPAANGARGLATPRAKRTAMEFHSSPLTLQPKKVRHRFDMNALLSHVQKDEAAKASAMRVAALLEEDNKGRAELGEPGVVTGLDDDADTPPALLDTIMEVLPEGKGEDGDRRDRLLRAVQRTEAATTRKRWHFFDASGTGTGVHSVERTPFPVKAATGPWKFLARTETRKADMLRGVASAVFHRGHQLPDEIFSWLLDEVCVESDPLLSEEYQNLLGAARDDSLAFEQVRRLLDQQRLRQLFRLAGASTNGLEMSERVQGSRDAQAPHSDGKHWHALRMLLRILATSGRCMARDSLVYATSMLLRMSLDTFIHRNVDIYLDHADAIASLLGAVAPRDWDTFVSRHAGPNHLPHYLLMLTAALRT
jgi:hypothetical protein